MTIIQWLVFRGIGHAQVGANEVIPHLPIVACGRTAWPGLVKYQPKPPPRMCEECAAALGIASSQPAREAVMMRRQNKSRDLPGQGRLF